MKKRNKKRHIAWTWINHSWADLRFEDGELLAVLTTAVQGFDLAVYCGQGTHVCEIIKIKVPGQNLEKKALARVRFHLAKFAKDSGKITRAEVRRLRMFTKRCKA